MRDVELAVARDLARTPDPVAPPFGQKGTAVTADLEPE
jgi:hypothetical protein